MNRPPSFRRLPALVAVLCLSIGVSYGQIILKVDFNAGVPTGSPTQTDYEAANVPGGAVTSDTSFVYTGLSTEQSTGTVTVTLGRGRQPNYTARDRGSEMSGEGTFEYFDLYRDFANPGTVHFTGLSANTQYMFVFYAYNNSAASTTKVTDATTGVAGDSATVAWTADYAFDASTPLSVFSNSLVVTTSATGTLDLWVAEDYRAQPWGSILNGFELHAIPEPSSAVLLGGASIIGLLYIKRNNALR